MTGTVDVRVRYSETDQMQRAHHRHYLVWCELGRTALMRERGVSYVDLEKSGVRLPVARAEVEYRGAAAYDDLLRVHTRIERVRSRDIVFYRITRADDEEVTLATARTTLICTDPDGRPRRFPSEVQTQLAELADG